MSYSIEQYTDRLRKVGESLLAGQLEDITIHAYELSDNKSLAERQQTWAEVYQNMQKLSNPEDFFHLGSDLFYQLPALSKITATFLLEEHPANPLPNDLLSVVTARGLLDYTKQLILRNPRNDEDFFNTLLGYGTGRLLEESLKTYAIGIGEPVFISEMDGIKNDYKRFRRDAFVKPNLNRSWPKTQTYFKNKKVGFSGKVCYYRDVNTVKSLIEKLGGVYAKSIDSTVSMVIVGTDVAPKNIPQSRVLSEEDFSEIVKHEMPQIPKKSAYFIRNEGISIVDFRREFTERFLGEAGLPPVHIKSIYDIVEQMIHAVREKQEVMYKLKDI
jgi:hypothetical protein